MFIVPMQELFDHVTAPCPPLNFCNPQPTPWLCSRLTCTG